MMTNTSRNFVAALSTVAFLSLGMSGAAMAQQGMPTATNSELDGTWVDASATSTAPIGASERPAVAQAGSFGYPTNNGIASSGQASAQRGALIESENASWVDGSARSTVDTRDAR